MVSLCRDAGFATVGSMSPDGVETAPLEDYWLTSEQIKSFDEQGYLVLPHRIPAGMLARLQAAADEWVMAGKKARELGEADDDYRFALATGARSCSGWTISTVKGGRLPSSFSAARRFWG